MKKLTLLAALLVLVPGSVIAASPTFVGQPKTQAELMRCEIVKSKYSGKAYKKGDKAIKTMAAKWAICIAPEKPKVTVAPSVQKTEAQIQLENEARNLALYGNPNGPVVPTPQANGIVRTQTPDTITLVDSRNVITENRVRETAREEIVVREAELSAPAPVPTAPVIVDRTAPEVMVRFGKDIHQVCSNCFYLATNEPVTVKIRYADFDALKRAIDVQQRQSAINDINELTAAYIDEMSRTSAEKVFEVNELKKDPIILFSSIPGLKKNTKYMFKVEVSDEAGNVFKQNFQGSNQMPLEWNLGQTFWLQEEIPVARMEIVDGPRREEDPVYRHSFCVYLKDRDGNNIITNEYVGVRESQYVDRSLNILRDRITSQCYPLKYDFRTEGKTTLTFTAGDVVEEVTVEAYRRGENGVLTEVR